MLLQDALKRIIEDAGLEYQENSVSYIFTCPRCSRKKKLYINKTNGRFVCFYCAAKENFRGRAEFALSALLGWPTSVVKARLYGTGQVPVESALAFNLSDFISGDDERPEDQQLIELAWPIEYLPIQEPSAAAGAEYLKSRGIPLRLAVEYGIQYDPIRERVVFPVASAHGQLYGWQARATKPTELKVISSKGIPRSSTLMFCHRITGSSHAVLCEGPIDAIKAHYCGGNVAAMGKIVTKAQIELLKNAGVQKLYLALDPDASPEMGALFREYSEDFQMYRLEATKKDLGEMQFEEVYEQFLEAKPLPPSHLFFWLRTPNKLLGAQ